jgi:hypothetical protein
MPLLAETDNYTHVIPTLDGLTAILAGFFFYCLAKPAMVKNRTQYWATFACLLLITLCYTLRLMLYNSSAGQVVTGIMIGLLQVGGMLLTVLYVGGLTTRDVADQMKDAYEDFRAGGDARKPVIVPLTGEKPKPRPEEPTTPREEIAPVAPPQPQPRVMIELPKKPDEAGKIPLE